MNSKSGPKTAFIIVNGGRLLCAVATGPPSLDCFTPHAGENYLCVSVHVLPLTAELKCSNVLDVVAFTTPSIVTVPQEPSPLPMLFWA